MLQYKKTVLCLDPKTQHRLNGNSFQNSAICTVQSWQYAAVYTVDAKRPDSIRHVTLVRRSLAHNEPAAWQYLSFDDYAQETDDGHNVICIGICSGDGTIHVSWDHHCDVLKYRVSQLGLATSPEASSWTAASFSPIMNALPGLSNKYFNEVTYPCFVPTETDLLFECRTGKAGAGSEMLFRYSSSSGTFQYIGTYLVGINNNPYINGLSYRDYRLHVSWTYRGFVDYDGASSASSTVHKAQAGPNGPENNYDLMYAYSDDLGTTWHSSAGETIAVCPGEENLDESDAPSGITPDTSGIVVQHIPKYSGIMNQEAQFIGPGGDFHVLNRDNTSGAERWRHFFRCARTGEWESAVVAQVQPTETGPRGKVVQDGLRDVYLVLPGNMDSSLTILKRSCSRSEHEGLKYSKDFELVWQGEGFDAEPLVDEQRLLGDHHVLSVFTRTIGPSAEVVVLNFSL